MAGTVSPFRQCAATASVLSGAWCALPLAAFHLKLACAVAEKIISALALAADSGRVASAAGSVWGRTQRDPAGMFGYALLAGPGKLRDPDFAITRGWDLPPDSSGVNMGGFGEAFRYRRLGIHWPVLNAGISPPAPSTNAP